MKPIPFSDVDDFRCMTVFVDGVEYEGIFTDVRIDRKTVPSQLFAYDIRENDDQTDSLIGSIAPYILVNFFGVFITNSPIPRVEEELEIGEWGFSIDDEPDEWLESLGK